jgi:integrase
VTRIYRTGNLRKRGKYWHIQFTNALGIRVSESTELEDYNKAVRFLQKRLGAVALGLNPEAKTNIGKMAKGYFVHLEVKANSVDKSLPAPTQAWRTKTRKREYKLTKRRWELHLRDYFAGVRRVTKAQLDEYVQARRKGAAKDSTIQRELSLLQKILNHNDVPNMPRFPRLSESSPREGFVEQANFDKLCSKIEDAGLLAMTRVAYKFGFRAAEIQNLLVRQIDGGAVKLCKGTTKNSRERRIVLDTESCMEIETLIKHKSPDDHVFTWEKGRKHGQPIMDFRASWENATTAAELPGLLFHDLRRSAIRNMTRAGVKPLVARKISGHLTGSVFERYDIVSDGDLAEAAQIIGGKSEPKQEAQS